MSEEMIERFRCLACEAAWIKREDGTWSLLSHHCGQCCDNAPMRGQMVAVADMEAWRPAITAFRKAASRKGTSEMAAFCAVRVIAAAAPAPAYNPNERLREALEECARGFDKHARHWRESAKRTSLIEDNLRAENADALAARARSALSPLPQGED